MTVPEISTGEAFGYGAGILGFFASAVIWLRQKWSRASVDVAKDRAEVDVIALLRSAVDSKETECKTLRDSNAALTKERNDAMFKLGEQGAQIVMFTTLLHDIKSDQKAQFDKAKEQLGQVGQMAEKSYNEANTVNQKIEKLGLQVIGGGKLNEQDPKAQETK